jgi:hypothetical protein
MYRLHLNYTICFVARTKGIGRQGFRNSTSAKSDETQIIVVCTWRILHSLPPKRVFFPSIRQCRMSKECLLQATLTFWRLIVINVLFCLEDSLFPKTVTFRWKVLVLVKSSVRVKMSMERRSWWHWKGKPTYCEKTLSQCQISHRLDQDGNRDSAVTARRLTRDAWRVYLFCRHVWDLEDYMARFDSRLPVGRVSQSVWHSLRAGRSGDRKSRWDEIFRTRPNRPWGPPSLLYNGYRVSFPGVKRTGRRVEHPPHLVPRLKTECSHTSTPPGPSWSVLRWTVPLLYLYFLSPPGQNGLLLEKPKSEYC